MRVISFKKKDECQTLIESLRRVAAQRTKRYCMRRDGTLVGYQEKTSHSGIENNREDLV